MLNIKGIYMDVFKIRNRRTVKTVDSDLKAIISNSEDYKNHPDIVRDFVISAT